MEYSSGEAPNLFILQLLPHTSTLSPILLLTAGVAIAQGYKFVCEDRLAVIPQDYIYSILSYPFIHLALEKH